MPTFANRDELNRFFSAANIGDWADKDRDGQVNANEQAAVDAAIDAAQAIVESYLIRAGYGPLSQDTAFAELPPATRALLTQWTVIIAGYHIHAWQGRRDTVNPLETLYRQTIDHLKSLHTGQPIAGLARDALVHFKTGSNPHDPTDHLDYLRGDAWDW